MKSNLKCLFLTLLILTTTCVSETQEWKGIKPLFSNKADVERILGVPSETNQFRSIYNFDDESIYVVFANDDAGNYECVRQMKAGTVLLIKVTLKKKKNLSDLEIDQSKLRPLKPSKPTNIGYNSYIDEEDGLVIRTLNGEVDQINYIATAKDKKICEEYYSRPEVFVQVMVNFQGNGKQIDKMPQKEPKRKSSKRKPK